MYELHPTIQSKTVVPIFEEHWKQEKKQLEIRNVQKKNSNPSTATDDTKLTNGSKAHNNAKSEKIAKDKKETEEKSKTEEEDNKPGVSVVKVLLKTFWMDYIICIVWNFFILFLEFCNPLLLR